LSDPLQDLPSKLAGIGASLFDLMLEYPKQKNPSALVMRIIGYLFTKITGIEKLRDEMYLMIIK